MDATVKQDSSKSVLFQPVLKANPTFHSCIITTNVSLRIWRNNGKMFVQQMGRIQQLLDFLQQKPLAPTYILPALQAEYNYTSYKPLVVTATQLLRREPTLHQMSSLSRCTKRSLLPFLGDTLNWLTGTATTKDVRSIKNRVRQLIATQHQQQETLVHIISVKVQNEWLFCCNNNPNNPMLLLLDNSDSLSIVEQLLQGPV